MKTAGIVFITLAVLLFTGLLLDACTSSSKKPIIKSYNDSGELIEIFNESKIKILETSSITFHSDNHIHTAIVEIYGNEFLINENGGIIQIK